MDVIVEGRYAAIKKGSSFEYVRENRLVSGADDYTLSITFPLRGCSRNIEIFGRLNRADVTAGKILFDCQLRDRNFSQFGALAITEISDSEIKAQFLQGRSRQNYDVTFDDIYINELDLGTAPTYSKKQITPEKAWSPAVNDFEAVALPWVNNDADSGLPHNFADYYPLRRSYQWAEDDLALTWQPYLLYITRKIAEAVDYTIDLDRWKADQQLRWLLVCNTLPPGWDVAGYARALPHWTVAEFFEKLELLLGGEFDIDHKSRHITFDFIRNVQARKPLVELDKVIDEFSREVTVDDKQCDYLGAQNIIYKEADYNLWKYHSCDWFIRLWANQAKHVEKYTTLSQLIEKNKWQASLNGSMIRDANFNKLLYAADVDSYFVIRTVSRTQTNAAGGMPYTYKCVLQPVNLLGARIFYDDDDAEETEIELIPARIDFTEDAYGNCLFLQPGSFSESGDGYRESLSKDDFWSTVPQSVIEGGKKDSEAEYYDAIYIGFWDGEIPAQTNRYDVQSGKATCTVLPHPVVEPLEVAPDWSSYKLHKYSLRLNTGSRFDFLQKVDPRVRSTFKFISDTIPDPRSIFLIRGKRYVCEKITATVSDTGISKLLKFEGYPVDEENAPIS